MFQAAKDAVTSRAAQAFVNQRIARYGEVRSLKIDSRSKQVEVVCQLNGEVSPISVKIERYEVHDTPGGKMLRVGSVLCSRPWLQALLNDLAQQREVPVPPWAASAL